VIKLADLLPSLIYSYPILGEKVINDFHIFPQYVTPNDLFIALPSLTKDFEILKINRAIEKGAQIIIKRKDLFYFPPKHVSIIEVDNPHKILSEISYNLFPSQPEIIAAITGTCGKTSVASFLQQLWTLMGYRSASMGTLGVHAGTTNNLILPSIVRSMSKTFITHLYLEAMRKKGITHLAFEATSAMLDQSRFDHVNFKAAAFTNFSYEHIGYHGSMENYFKAKERLFTEILPSSGLAILNSDDQNVISLKAKCRNRKHKIIEIGKKNGDIRFRKFKSSASNNYLSVYAFGSTYEITTSLCGDFQAQNIMFALALVVGLGGDIKIAIDSIPYLKAVKGRLEYIGCLPNQAKIYIDYAHKPGALESVLSALKAMYNRAKITLVFGCGGGTDRTKRLMMGQIANQLADKIIITDDNPRNEPSDKIYNHILQGCPEAILIPSRAEAIFTAISELGPEEVCLIAGKGHETKQEINGQQIPFDDSKIAAQIIKNLE
jgi:UDP-N-acetylmuramoyl-L-alanyl-D-glutamate--2,6-diaminopimelate ligase